MKWIIFAAVLASTGAFAENRSFESPEIRCLNDHTLPFIDGELSAQVIVDDAFVRCKDPIDDWRKSRKSLPQQMQKQQFSELYDFYIRMIDIRRKAGY